MSTIHHTSIIDKKAIIGDNVKIGPFCVIGPNVVLHNNIEIKSHVVIEGYTEIGESSIIYPFASIGHNPQDLKYKGEESKLVIGKNNTIREYVTMQPGTKDDKMITSVGDNGLFMVGVHIAHDVIIGNNVIIANYANIAGHVIIGDNVIIGGLSGILQRTRVGNNSMIGGMSAVDKDVIPFGLVKNERAILDGLNIIGMKRQGIDKKEILESSKVIAELFLGVDIDDNIFLSRLNRIEQQYQHNSILKQIINFIKQDTTRNLCNFKSRK